MSSRRRSSSRAPRAALRHIKEARVFSLEMGGTDTDVKNYFFNLCGPALEEIFVAYGQINGADTEQYARETFPKWKSGSTKMSGLVAQRLFALLPPRMPLATKLELAGNLWQKLGPSSGQSFTVGPVADASAVIRTIQGKLAEVIQSYQIPDNVRKRFDWLSSGDITVKEKLCNHFRQLEWQLVITKLNLELPLLQRQMRDYGAQTTSAYTKLQINRHSAEIWIDQRLGNKFREGYPEPPDRPSIFAKLVSVFR